MSNNQYTKVFLFLFFFSTTRLWIYFELSKYNLLTIESRNYINQDFFELFIFNHTIPNGHLILEKIISLFSIEKEFLFYTLNIFYSLMLCYFLNDLTKKIKIKKNYRLLFLILVSVILIPYEIWRPDHHDHINIFLIAYLFWSTFYFICYKKKLNHIILSLILLNFFYTLGFIYSLLIFVFLFFYNKLTKVKLGNNYFLKFISVFTIIFLIFLKNYLSISIFSPTSMGGANLIQRTVHAIGEEKYKSLIELKKEKLPLWWISITQQILDKNKKIEMVDIRISNLAHGKLDKNLFLNFEKQKKIILNSQKQDEDIYNYIKKDKNILMNKKWLYDYGYKQNLLSTKYQSLGKNIFVEACKLFPKEMIFGELGNKGIVLTTFQMISYGGLLPNYYESDSRYTNKFYYYLYIIFRFLIIFTLLLTPFVFLKRIKFYSLTKKDLFYILLIISLLSITVITSIITCCENPRMFVMQFYLISILCVMNLDYFFKNKKELNK